MLRLTELFAIGSVISPINPFYYVVSLFDQIEKAMLRLGCVQAGGFLTGAKGWRWLMWLLLMMVSGPVVEDVLHGRNASFLP